MIFFIYEFVEQMMSNEIWLLVDSNWYQLENVINYISKIFKKSFFRDVKRHNKRVCFFHVQKENWNFYGIDNVWIVRHIAKILPWMIFSCWWIPFIAEMCDEYKINRGKLIMCSMKNLVMKLVLIIE